VGIVPKGAIFDGNAFVNVARETHFLFEPILKALQLEFEKAQASIDADRVHILNSMTGNIRNVKSRPPKRHPKYTELINAVRGAFVSSSPALQAAARAGGNNWTDILKSMSK